VTAQVNPIDALSEFPNQPYSHDCLMESNLDTRGPQPGSWMCCPQCQGPGKTRISASADTSVSG
jgi:hypothetical protein